MAGALRFYGVDFGLPSSYHPDETPKINAIMRMIDNGDLNPRYFLHPSLLLYSTYALNSIIQFFGLFPGEFRDTAILAGRMVSAGAGTLSVFLVYAIAKRIYSPIVGIFSAALLASFPLHVTCSRYLKEDALLLFFILACLLAVLKAIQEDRKWLVVVAGLLAGCASATKYSGLLAVGIVGMAPWLRSRSFIPDTKYLAVTFVGISLCAVSICSMYTVFGTR